MPESEETTLPQPVPRPSGCWPLLATCAGAALGFVASIALVNLTMWLSNIVRGNDFWGKGSPAPFLWGWPLFALVCMVAGWRWCGFAARKWQKARPPRPSGEPLD